MYTCTSSVGFNIEINENMILKKLTGAFLITWKWQKDAAMGRQGPALFYINLIRQLHPDNALKPMQDTEGVAFVKAKTIFFINVMLSNCKIFFIFQWHTVIDVAHVSDCDKHTILSQLSAVYNI